MEHTLRNGKPLSVMPARQEDAAAMLQHMEAIGGESDNLTFGAGEVTFTLEQEEAYLAHVAVQSTSVMLLGWMDGEIVASAVLTGNETHRARHNAELGISVRKAHWRQGIGEIMMRELIDFARQTGALRVIHLSARKENAAGIALYEKLGFERVGTHRGFLNVRGVYHDMIIMELHLSAKG